MKNNRIFVVRAVFTALCFLTAFFGCTGKAHAEAGQLTHRHTGSRENGGGCFGTKKTETYDCHSYNVGVGFNGTDYIYVCGQCGTRWSSPGKVDEPRCSGQGKSVYYELSCGRDGAAAVSFSCDPSTRDWVKELDLNASYSVHEGGINISGFTWNGSPGGASCHVTENGTYQLGLTGSGNVDFSPTISVTVDHIDRTPPQIGSFQAASDAWQSSVELLVNASDAQSGLDAEAYSFDGGASWGASNSYTVTKNGTYRVSVRDAVGNVSTAETTVSHIDIAAPGISVSTSPSVHDWYEGSLTVCVQAQDAESGLADEPYSFDGGAVYIVGNSATLSESGTLEIAVKDRAGNVARYSFRAEKKQRPQPTPAPGGGNSGGTGGQGSGSGAGSQGSGNGTGSQGNGSAAGNTGSGSGGTSGGTGTGTGGTGSGTAGGAQGTGNTNAGTGMPGSVGDGTAPGTDNSGTGTAGNSSETGADRNTGTKAHGTGGRETGDTGRTGESGGTGKGSGAAGIIGGTGSTGRGDSGGKGNQNTSESDKGENGASGNKRADEDGKRNELGGMLSGRNAEGGLPQHYPDSLPRIENMIGCGTEEDDADKGGTETDGYGTGTDRDGAGTDGDGTETGGGIGEEEAVIQEELLASADAQEAAMLRKTEGAPGAAAPYGIVVPTVCVAGLAAAAFLGWILLFGIRIDTRDERGHYRFAGFTHVTTDKQEKLRVVPLTKQIIRNSRTNALRIRFGLLCHKRFEGETLLLRYRSMKREFEAERTVELHIRA